MGMASQAAAANAFEHAIGIVKNIDLKDCKEDIEKMKQRIIEELTIHLKSAQMGWY